MAVGEFAGPLSAAGGKRDPPRAFPRGPRLPGARSRGISSRFGGGVSPHRDGVAPPLRGPVLVDCRPGTVAGRARARVPAAAVRRLLERAVVSALVRDLGPSLADRRAG